MPGNRPLDLVIFGAAGHTGKFALREMSNVVKNYPGLRWGVAGRSEYKLSIALQEASVKTGLNICNVKILLADINNGDALRRMCDETKLVVNCCGPYMKYGEPVVAAAVAAGTHHVDVSAENQFAMLLEQKYHHLANAAGVYVVNSCGLCSVPVDLGVNYLEKHFDGTLNSVESYMTTHCSSKMLIENWKCGVIRYSSWECMIDSMAKLAYTAEEPRENNHLPTQSQLQRRSLLHKNMDRWCLPYPISDPFIIRRSQRDLHEKEQRRPIQYKPYLVFPNFFVALGTLITYMLIHLLALMSFTRKLLLKYPKLFSFGMVTYDENIVRIKGGSEFSYVLIGTGWDKNDNLNEAPGKKIIANITVSGDDPAYVGTVVAMLRCAVTILYEEEKMPETGGVMTPGYAFYKTNLLQRLQENNYKYEIKTVL